MKIETKYNIGDRVWLIARNNICKLKIKYVSATFCESFRYVKYGFGRTEHTAMFDVFKESELFPTKEELLKSL